MTRRVRLAAEPLEDRITPVVVNSLNPGLTGGTLPASATSIQVNYSVAVVGGANAGNFELRGIGTDGLLGTSDDVIVSLSAAYSGTTSTLSFSALPSNSAANVWRLTVKSTITDTSGIALDGDANGNPGGNFVRDFVGEPTPYLTLLSPNGQAFDIQAGGFGAGQLLQGTADAFDGLNRLNVGGVDYQPAPATTSSIDLQAAMRTSASSDPLSTSAMTDLPDLLITVAVTGLYRLSALVPVQNFSASSNLIVAQIVVNGSAVESRPVTFGSGTNTFSASAFLEDSRILNVGDVVKVQARTFAGNASLNGSSVLRLWRLNPIPNFGPSVTVQSAARTSASSDALSTSAMTDIPDLTMVASETGLYRLSALIPIQNFSVAANLIAVQIVVNGVAVETRQITFESSTNTSTESVALEDFRALNAGDIVKVQARTFAGSASLNGTGVLRLWRSNPIPSFGASTTVFSASRVSASTDPLSTAAMSDVPDLTLTVPTAGRYRLSSLISIQNFSASANLVGVQIVVNGTAVDSRSITFGSGTNTFTESLALEDARDLNAGDIVKVQARTFAGNASLNGTGVLRLFRFNSFPNPATANGGRTVVTPTQTFSGLVVNREITVPSAGTQDFVRSIEVISNPTANTITTPVRITGNLGSSQAVFATQNGNLTAEPTDQWIGTDDADGTGSPAAIHYIHGPAGLRPSAVAVSGDNITWTFDLTLVPGQTLRLASLTVLGTTRAAAIASARSLVTASGFGGEAASFLSQAQLQSLANFGFPAVAPSANLVIGGGSGGATLLAPNLSGQYGSPASIGGLSGAIRTASADVNGDEIPDTILVTGPGTPIRFAVVSGLDNSTLLIPPTAPFVGSEDFTGGGFVSAADLDGDGRAEFAITPDQGGGPRVTIFSLVGSTPTVRVNFFGIDDPNFRGGARSALGDTNRDGTPDLLVAAGFGGGPRVTLFNGATILSRRDVLANFFAFPEDAVTLRNGIFAALGDITGDGFADLIFGGGPGGAPRVFILSGALLTSNSPNLFSQPVANFFVAGNSNDRGGVRVAVKNADGDARADLAVGSGEGSPANVRVYRGLNFITNGEPGTFQDISVFGGVALTDGVFVG